MINASSACVRAAPLPSTWLSNPSSAAPRIRGRSSAITPLVVFTVLGSYLLLWGIAFELAFAAAVIYLPPLQTAFGTAALGWHELAPLTVFPVVVWGSDELRRWALRRRRASVATEVVANGAGER